VTNHAVDLINGLAQVRSLEAGGAQGAQEGVEVEAVVEVVACDGVGISLRKLRGAQYGVDDLGGQLLVLCHAHGRRCSSCGTATKKTAVVEFPDCPLLLRNRHATPAPSFATTHVLCSAADEACGSGVHRCPNYL
jgi:hypothetical protein